MWLLVRTNRGDQIISNDETYVGPGEFSIHTIVSSFRSARNNSNNSTTQVLCPLVKECRNDIEKMKEKAACGTNL